MCEAIQANKNWSNANTSVIFDPETNNSNVYLYGNLIATVTDTDMTIFDGGRQSVTTKSRLNALCDYFCIDGEGVFQENFKWFVESWLENLPSQVRSLTSMISAMDSLSHKQVYALSTTFA